MISGILTILFVLVAGKFIDDWVDDYRSDRIERDRRFSQLLGPEPPLDWDPPTSR